MNTAPPRDDMMSDYKRHVNTGENHLPKSADPMQQRVGAGVVTL